MSGTQFVQRGQALVDRGQYQEAVKVCRLGLLARPTEVAGRLVLATALCELDRFDEVLAEMRVALELEPNNGRAHYLKARALLRKGDALQAREIAERAAQLAPGDRDVDALVSDCNAALGASGKPRAREATAGLVEDHLDSHTKHYPAHLGAAGGPEGITRPRRGLAPDPDDILPPADILSVGDRSGTIELDPEIEGIEVEPDDTSDLADPPLPAPRQSSESIVELNTGDVELVTASEVARLPDQQPAGRGRASPQADTASYRKPHGRGLGGPSSGTQPTLPESPFGTLRQQGLRDGPPLDEMFPDADSEGGISSVDLSQSPVSGSIDTPPRHNVPGQPGFDGGPSIPSLAHGGLRPPPPRRGHPESKPPRSRTEDMRVIKEGLGIQDTGDSRKRRKRRKQERARAGARPGRRRTAVWVYALVAVVVVAGAVFAGLEVRRARLDRQVKRAMRDAEKLASADTYRAYWMALRAYEKIYDAQQTAATRGALARMQAEMAAEFGEGLERAGELVNALGDQSSADAVAARGYLALAHGDARSAAQHAARLTSEFPTSRYGGYVAGRAALLDGNPEDAAAAFRAALGKGPWPAAHVGLGIAEAAIGKYHEARAAFDAALNLSEGNPAAVIERARVLVAMNQLPGAKEPEASLEAIRSEGKRPVEDQQIGVARRQVGWASLALAEVALARGDRNAARKALDDAVESRPIEDWRFSDALSAAYLRVGDHEKARAEAEWASKKWPSRAGVHVRLAEAALDAGDPESGLAELAKVPDIERRPDALAARGRARLLLHQVDEAAADLDAALAVRPQLRAALIARAEVDLHRGDSRGAVNRLQPLYEEAATPDIGIVYASALRRTGERERARAVLDKVLAASSGARAHIELARLDRDEGRFKEARRAYATAIEADPGGIEPRLEAAQLNLDMGDVQGAREALDALTNDAPDNGRVLVAAARVRTLTGDIEGASGLIERADRLPVTPRWLVKRERGRNLLRSQRPKQAIQSLEGAAELQPDDGETRLLLLDAYLTADDGKGAEAALADVLKRFANKPEADLALGRVHLFNDRLKDSMIAFKNALRALGEDRAPPRRLSEAHFWIGRVHYFDGKLGDAVKSLSRATKLDPGNADAYFVLGQVQQERSKLKEAAEAYTAATKADPSGIPDAWFFLGETSLRLRRKRPAKDALEAYLKLAPAGDFATEAKDMLADL